MSNQDKPESELEKKLDDKLQDLLGQNYVDEYSGSDRHIGTDEIAEQLMSVIEAYVKEQVTAARLAEAKHIDNLAAKKFDDLCQGVRTDPHLGNSSKGKKDNFLDGAESMLLVSTLRKNQLSHQSEEVK